MDSESFTGTNDGKTKIFRAYSWLGCQPTFLTEWFLNQEIINFLLKPIRRFYCIFSTCSQIFFSFLHNLLCLQYKVTWGCEYGWGRKRPPLLEVVTEKICDSTWTFVFSYFRFWNFWKWKKGWCRWQKISYVKWISGKNFLIF